MTKEELQNTIDWLRDFIFRMEDRFDGDQLKEQLDRLKITVRELEDRLEKDFDCGRPTTVGGRSGGGRDAL